MGEPEIIWDVKARSSFKKQIDHIKKDSLQAAEKVRSDIFDILDDLPGNPLKFPADKFKSDNDGNFRAFEKHGIRIAYLVTELHIRILRVRHVKQEPQQY
jgi:plasmid stabilization system protein ParE